MVICVLVAGEKVLTRLDGCPQGENAIVEGVGGGGGLDLRQQIVGVGVGSGEGLSGVGGHLGLEKTVHGIVIVLRLSSLRILRVAYPFQNVGVGMVAVLGHVANGVRGGFNAVAIRAVSRAAGDLIGSVDDGYGCVIAIGIVGKLVQNFSIICWRKQ